MESGKKLDVPGRILIVEDAIAVGQGLAVLLTGLGYEVLGPVATCREALRAAEEHRPDLVLMDIQLKGDQEGIEAAERIGTDLDIPVVYLTGNSEEQLMQRAVLTKPYGYLRKPALVCELRAAIEIALHKHSIDKGLSEREELHRNTISGISDTILITAEDGNFTYVSPNTHLIFGYSQEEVRKLGNVDRLLGRDVYDPDALEKYGEISNIERGITDTSGQEHTLLVTVKRVSIKGGTVLYSCRDITDRKRAEDQVSSSLEEKEVLLREVHHRVKNNLAVMSSLLNLQARYVQEESHRHLFEDARARIRTMAVAHELLYQAENLADLDIPEYLGRLADHLVVSTRSLGTAISLRKDIQPVSFGLDTAIPLGFILTELVTNSIKHAFPQGEEGEIRIALRSLDDDEFELSVTDTGVGVPPDVDPHNPRSLGLNLINTFVNQLGGTFEVRTDKGTETRVRFTDASQSYEGEPAPPVLPGSSQV